MLSGELGSQTSSTNTSVQFCISFMGCPALSLQTITAFVCSFLSIYLCWVVYFCFYLCFGTQLRRFGVKELFKKVFFYVTVKLWKCSGNIAATLYIPTTILYSQWKEVQARNMCGNLSSNLGDLVKMTLDLSLCYYFSMVMSRFTTSWQSINTM